MVHRRSASRPSCCGCGAHDADELSHYSAGTSDVEFDYPWGWGELEGIANRTDYDLTQHAKFSGQRLEYFDQATNEHYVPYVIEPAAGATRAMMAFLLAAYDEDEIGGEARTVLRLHPRLAPYKVAVLPLSKKDTLTPLAREVLGIVQQRWMADYDDTQSIGRRYRRQDEIGTPLAVTVDFESLEDRAVTIRDRDTTDQVRVPDRRPRSASSRAASASSVSSRKRRVRARSVRPSDHDREGRGDQRARGVTRGRQLGGGRRASRSVTDHLHPRRWSSPPPGTVGVVVVPVGRRRRRRGASADRRGGRRVPELCSGRSRGCVGSPMARPGGIG